MFSLGSMLLEGGGTSVFTTFQSRNCKVLHTLPSGGLGGVVWRHAPPEKF